MKAYLFWYKSSETAPTEYIYIIAYSHTQASYFFNKKGYTKMYDYERTPIDEEEITKQYDCGTILGINAEL